jgi:hypothetical protein
MGFEFNDSLILGLTASISAVVLACFSMMLKSRCKDFNCGCIRIDCIPAKEDPITPTLTRQNTIRIPPNLVNTI